MPWIMRDQHGRYLRINDYGHEQYSIEALDLIDGQAPTVFETSWDFREGVVIIDQINAERERYVENVKRMGLKVSPDSIDKLERIEVTMVEMMTF